MFITFDPWALVSPKPHNREGNRWITKPSKAYHNGTKGISPKLFQKFHDRYSAVRMEVEEAYLSGLDNAGTINNQPMRSAKAIDVVLDMMDCSDAVSRSIRHFAKLFSKDGEERAVCLAVDYLKKRRSALNRKVKAAV